MGLFNKPDTKFIRLVSEIDKRLKVYEKLVVEGNEPHPPGLEMVYQEFKNLKIRAWAIETGDNKATELVKDFTDSEVLDELRKGEPHDGKGTETETGKG